MAQLTIVYWRDVPAQVVVKSGRKTAKRELEARFQEAIDHAAMRAGAHGTDTYLAEWRRSEPRPCGDDLDAEADAAARRIAREYGRDRLSRLIEGGGLERSARRPDDESGRLPEGEVP